MQMVLGERIAASSSTMTFHLGTCLTLILCLFTCSEQRDVSYSQINQLLNEFLLDNNTYNTNLRPIQNQSAAVDVWVTFSYLDFLSLAQNEQDVVISGFFALTWRDEFVAAFFAKLFQQGTNVNKLMVSSSQLWMPDVSILSSDEHALLDLSSTPAKLWPGGYITVLAGGVMKFQCKLDLMYFPFDHQTCIAVINPWLSDSSEVRLLSKGVIIQNITHGATHSEWILINITSADTGYSGDHYSTNALSYEITIRRRYVKPVMDILLPTILQAVLVVVVFCIPPESGERMSFAITVFLAFSMWSVTINDSMPRNDDSVPLLAGCLSVLITASAFAVVISSIVVELDRPRHHNQLLPKWVHMVRDAFNSIPFRKRGKRVGPEEGKEQLSWRDVATAVDRVFFWTFLIILITGGITLVAMYANAK